MAMLYYAPYVAFLSTNQDMICLRKDMKSGSVDAMQITKQYFITRDRSSRYLTPFITAPVHPGEIDVTPAHPERHWCTLMHPERHWCHPGVP